jgi:hypothetical protein
LSDHQGKFDGYRNRVARIIGGTTKADFPKLEIADQFATVYRSTLSDIGLFETETSYGVIYCYSNTFQLLQKQATLISELDSLLNTSMLSHHVDDLRASEVALIAQIERIMQRLAQQSRPIPFTPSKRT